MDSNNLNINPVPQFPKENPNPIQETNQIPENKNELNKPSQFTSKIIKILAILILLILIMGSVSFILFNKQNKILNFSKNSKSTKTPAGVNANVTFIKIPTPSLSKVIMNDTISYKNNYDPKISLRYPANNSWEVKDAYYNTPKISHIPGQIGVISVTYKYCQKDCEESINIDIIEKGSKADQGLGMMEKAYAVNPAFKLVSKKSITQDKLKGTRFEFEREGSRNGNVIRYEFTNEKYAFYITVNPQAGSLYKMNLQEFGDEIAKTIKFSQ